jgi:regulator of ribonuclease activity A
VRKALEEPGAGRVLVVDAGASMRCAVLGDNLAENAQRNGWSVSGAGGGWRRPRACA